MSSSTTCFEAWLIIPGISSLPSFKSHGKADFTRLCSSSVIRLSPIFIFLVPSLDMTRGSALLHLCCVKPQVWPNHVAGVTHMTDLRRKTGNIPISRERCFRSKEFHPCTLVLSSHSLLPFFFYPSASIFVSICSVSFLHCIIFC